MKAQELMVSCFYNDDGESIQDLLYSSFAAFLKREFGKFASTSRTLGISFPALSMLLLQA